MAEWKGVPYFFDVTENASYPIRVLVEKMPSVIIESSPFSLETIIGALFAAILPSVIAWRALRENYKLAKFQSNLLIKKDLAENIRVALSEYIASAVFFFTGLPRLIKYKTGEDKSITDLTLAEMERDTETFNRKMELYKNKLILLVPPSSMENNVFLSEFTITHNAIAKIRADYNENKNIDIEDIQKQLDKLMAVGFEMIRSLEQ
ncbi:TPA: hypothetical protein ACXHWU_001630 [Morganella morganii]